MARPERNTVDYFPHLIGDGKKIFAIENKYGNDGYAAWFKILEKLATTDYHFLNLADEGELMYIAAKCRIQEDRLLAIITDLSRLNVFDKTLWEIKIIWCQSFIDSIQDAYFRRNNNCMTKEGLCNHLPSLGIHLPTNCKHKSSSKPQTILKDIKEEESIDAHDSDKKKFVPPTIDQWRAYFHENGYSDDVSERSWKGYDVANWHNTLGKKIKNWKQTAINVWFKEDNLLQKVSPQRKMVY